jgi:hypothetical protein
MQKRLTITRFVFGVWIAWLAGGAVGCSDAGSPIRPAAADPQATRQFPQGSAISAPPVSAELAAVRAATAPFHDLAVANAADYVIPPGEPCVPTPVGVMGIHAPNLPLMGDQQLDPLRPEALLYVPAGNGGLRLVGVEYFQFVLLRNLKTLDLGFWFKEGAWDPAEYEVVTPTPRLFGQTFDGPMPGHIPAMPWHWDLHVWVWSHNPAGMFAEGNPSLSCN